MTVTEQGGPKAPKDPTKKRKSFDELFTVLDD